MAYSPEDSWKEFETTGSVAAYLSYRGKANQTTDSATRPNKESAEESQEKEGTVFGNYRSIGNRNP